MDLHIFCIERMGVTWDSGEMGCMQSSAKGRGRDKTSADLDDYLKRERAKELLNYKVLLLGKYYVYRRVAHHTRRDYIFYD